MDRCIPRWQSQTRETSDISRASPSWMKTFFQILSHPRENSTHKIAKTTYPYKKSSIKTLNRNLMLSIKTFVLKNIAKDTFIYYIFNKIVTLSYFYKKQEIQQHQTLNEYVFELSGNWQVSSAFKSTRVAEVSMRCHFLYWNPITHFTPFGL